MKWNVKDVTTWQQGNKVNLGTDSRKKLLFFWILFKLHPPAPPPPHLDNLYNFFYVEIQDLKVSLGLKYYIYVVANVQIQLMYTLAS